MAYEQGNIGSISSQGIRLDINEWRLRGATDEVVVYCDSLSCSNHWDLKDGDLSLLIGRHFLLRADNENHIYYGVVICKAIAKPQFKHTDNAPHLELCSKSLALYCEFMHSNYGPYRISEAAAMARNGNTIFFDLIPLAEIERRAASGDVRFINTTY